MARKRLNKDRIQSQTEINRRHQDKYASIDEDMKDAFKKIDTNRKQFASLSL